MAEPLKDSFGPEVAERIADAIDAAFADFDRDRFLAAALDGFDGLELTPRARQISDALAATLPTDRARALEILLAGLGPESDGDDLAGMAAFHYLPHVFFVSDHCVDEFEPAMLAQYELTKRFTAEFSIRTFLTVYPDATLRRLEEWTDDPSEHVRRLVSEGTRPRLPWAPRLPEFQRDPTPVIALLEQLRDDPSESVRRSVANNLNDIAKDHPDLVVEIAGRWWDEPNAQDRRNRERMIRHGLRTLVKQGHPGALGVLGYEATAAGELTGLEIDPPTPRIGDKIRVAVTMTNPSALEIRALVDLRVHFVKASGETSPKVFKGSELVLAPSESASFAKTVSLAQHSTRTHHPGRHRVEVLSNGVSLGSRPFDLGP